MSETKDLSLADVMADFEPTDRCRQEYEALTRERDDWRDRFGVRAPEGILSAAESHAFTMRGIEACYAAREKAEVERDALKAALACEPLAWIMAELLKAEGKFPSFPTDPIHAATVVSEESGELAQAALQWVYEGGSREAMRKEAIQTGAMALRFLLHEPTMRQQPCEQLPRPALSPRGEGTTPPAVQSSPMTDVLVEKARRFGALFHPVKESSDPDPDPDYFDEKSRGEGTTEVEK